MPYKSMSKYVRQKLKELQGETKKSISIVGNFNTLLIVIDRASRQNISKDTVELNSPINQLDLTDIYGTLHPTTAEYTFLSSHGTFTKIYHVLGHNTYLNKV